jgi:MFS transporter, NNP family, nitrate/nitrite transporter
MAIPTETVLPIFPGTLGVEDRTLSEPRRRNRWIDDWRPEDPAFWAATGQAVARRNLIFSILSEHIGFSIWSMWSVFVLFLGPKFGFDPGQKFLLTTIPTAVGSVIRIPYTFAVAKFGGRNWTVISAALLLIPCLATAAVLKPGVSFSTLLLVAALAGIGGGNFSSSMSNIDSFYPQRLKGWALGLNAGGGNIGVAVVQLVGLMVLATAGKAHPRVILAVYMPLIVISLLLASWKMDNLTNAANEKRSMRDVAREPHAWVMSFLYIGTFGSFIGFGFAFGQVLQVQFAHQFNTPIKAAYLTFLGPLLGSLVRPVGGKLADRIGGAKVTISAFVAMTIGASLVLYASIHKSLPLFLIGFISLFILTGLGNGSAYKMIPAIFRSKAKLAIEQGASAAGQDSAARRKSRALIGIAGAVGAFGGVAVNLALRQAFLTSKTGNAAYVAFIAFYVVCVVVTWAVYLRPSARRLAGI